MRSTSSVASCPMRSFSSVFSTVTKRDSLIVDGLSRPASRQRLTGRSKNPRCGTEVIRQTRQSGPRSIRTSTGLALPGWPEVKGNTQTHTSPELNSTGHRPRPSSESPARNRSVGCPSPLGVLRVHIHKDDNRRLSFGRQGRGDFRRHRQNGTAREFGLNFNRSWHNLIIPYRGGVGKHGLSSCAGRAML